MAPGPLPYVLEDRTGSHTFSDFDEIYDRVFLRVARVAPSPNHPSRTTTMIYDMGRRTSRHRDSLPFQKEPIVVMEFQPDEGLGNITFVIPSRSRPGHSSTFSLPMSRYLRKTSMFGGSLSRKFTGSDGREYKWTYQSIPGQEWTCTTVPENYLVSHYDLKAPDVRAYNVSGHNLTIYEQFAHLSVELLASLTLMRHIAQYKL